MAGIFLSLKRTVFLPKGSPGIFSIGKIRVDIRNAEIKGENGRIFCLGDADILLEYLSQDPERDLRRGIMVAEDNKSSEPRPWQALMTLPFELIEEGEMICPPLCQLQVTDVKWFVVAPRAIELEVKIKLVADEPETGAWEEDLSEKMERGKKYQPEEKSLKEKSVKGLHDDEYFQNNPVYIGQDRNENSNYPIREGNMAANENANIAAENLNKKEAAVKPEAKAEMKAEMKPETKAEMKPEAKAEMKPEAKAEMKPEAKAEMKPEAKAEMKPEAKAEMKPEAKAEMKPEAKAEMKPETKAEMKPQANMEVNPEETMPLKTRTNAQVNPEETMPLKTRINVNIGAGANAPLENLEAETEEKENSYERERPKLVFLEEEKGTEEEAPEEELMSCRNPDESICCDDEEEEDECSLMPQADHRYRVSPTEMAEQDYAGNLRQENLRRENNRAENIAAENMPPEKVAGRYTGPENIAAENIRRANIAAEQMRPENIRMENLRPANILSESSMKNACPPGQIYHDSMCYDTASSCRMRLCRVLKGESLEGIAHRTGVPANVLAARNRLADSNLKEGMYLIIPE